MQKEGGLTWRTGDAATPLAQLATEHTSRCWVPAPPPPGAGDDCGAGLRRAVVHAAGGCQGRLPAQQVPRPQHPGGWDDACGVGVWGGCDRGAGKEERVCVRREEARGGGMRVRDAREKRAIDGAAPKAAPSCMPATERAPPHHRPLPYGLPCAVLTNRTLHPIARRPRPARWTAAWRPTPLNGRRRPAPTSS